jgi:hypothetical protein
MFLLSDPDLCLLEHDLGDKYPVWISGFPKDLTRSIFRPPMRPLSGNSERNEDTLDPCLLMTFQALIETFHSAMLWTVSSDTLQK